MFAPETRILVIDDMPSIRDLVRNQLRGMGFKNIIEAEDGDDGLQKLIDRKGAGVPIQLVISDWNMPRMKGLDLLRKVRSIPEWKDLPFVLLTSESEREQVTEAVLAGVSQYIVKPFAPKIFEEKLKSVCTKHQGQNQGSKN